jgi:hypothetical protein
MPLPQKLDFQGLGVKRFIDCERITDKRKSIRVGFSLFNPSGTRRFNG